MYFAPHLVIAPESSFQGIAQDFLSKAAEPERWSSLSGPLDTKRLDEFLHFSMMSGVQRRAVLHGADMWPLVVSNRLLAILEEPAPGLELLVLSKSASILPTISSRLIGRYGARPQDATTLLRPSHQPGTHVRAKTLQEALFLLGSSHTGHDHSKLLHAAQNHV